MEGLLLETINIDYQLFFENIIVAFVWILIIVCIWNILKENNTPDHAILWIITLLLFRTMGVVLYYIFGLRLSKKWTVKYSRGYLDNNSKDNRDIDKSAFLKKLEKSTGSKITSDNEIEIFVNGGVKMNMLINDIENAKHYIFLMYYIIENDETGKKLLEILSKKILENVTVRVIYDYEKGKDNPIFNLMSSNGILVVPFFKEKHMILPPKFNHRNHRKIVIIDGCVAFTGGMNIANRTIYGCKWGNWQDIHLRITGQAVDDLNKIFINDWFIATKEEINYVNMFKKHTIKGDKLIQIISSGPLDEYSNIKNVFLQLIYHAKSYIYIQTPYFIPSNDIYDALIVASKAGVDVRIMMPCNSDFQYIFKASVTYFEKLISVGVRVYLYKTGFLHSKLFVSDDYYTVIGSTNIDNRSLLLNFEIDTVIYNKDVALSMLNNFLSDELESEIVDNIYLSNRNNILVFEQRIYRLFSSIM